jgi:hypothetical protein
MKSVKFEIVFCRSNYIPLHLTAARGSVDMPRALLGHTADPSCRDVDKSPAAKIARHWRVNSQPEFYNEIIKLLNLGGHL